MALYCCRPRYAIQVVSVDEAAVQDPSMGHNFRIVSWQRSWRRIHIGEAQEEV